MGGIRVYHSKYKLCRNSSLIIVYLFRSKCKSMIEGILTQNTGEFAIWTSFASNSKYYFASKLCTQISKIGTWEKAVFWGWFKNCKHANKLFQRKIWKYFWCDSWIFLRYSFFIFFDTTFRAFVMKCFICTELVILNFFALS